MKTNVKEGAVHGGQWLLGHRQAAMRKVELLNVLGHQGNM